MKKLFVSAMVIAALTSVVACNKDKDNDSTPSNNTLTKLRAKWGVGSIVVDAPGTEDDGTYTGVTADYVDFRADNKVYTEFDGEKDTSSYSLVNDSKLVIDGDTATISKLNSSELVLSESYTEDGGTSSIIYNLKK